MKHREIMAIKARGEQARGARACSRAGVNGESALGRAGFLTPLPTRHGPACCPPSADRDFSFGPPEPGCDECHGTGVVRFDEPGCRGAAPCKCRNRPMRLDLPGVRVQGFDRLFKTLEQAITPDELHQPVQPLIILGPGGDFTHEVHG